jgi:phosphopantothenoylcysteine synthetase/decarboxylase
MPESWSPAAEERVLYLILCAAPPALHWPRLVEKLHEAGWSVHAIPTPTAATWLDVKRLAEATRHDVRYQQRLPSEANELPPARAVLVAPATFNTVNKWAAGVSDTFALGLLNELLGHGVPITVAAYCKPALASHPTYRANIALLRQSGVTILEGPDSIVSTGDGYRWANVIRALTRTPLQGA